MKTIEDTWAERRKDKTFVPHAVTYRATVFVELTTKQFDFLWQKGAVWDDDSPQSAAAQKMLEEEYGAFDIDYTPHMGCGIEFTVDYENYLKMDEIVNKLTSLLS